MLIIILLVYLKLNTCISRKKKADLLKLHDFAIYDLLNKLQLVSIRIALNNSGQIFSDCSLILVVSQCKEKTAP